MVEKKDSEWVTQRNKSKIMYKLQIRKWTEKVKIGQAILHHRRRRWTSSEPLLPESVSESDLPSPSLQSDSAVPAPEKEEPGNQSNSGLK